jgi:hypothetical protein
MSSFTENDVSKTHALAASIGELIVAIWVYWRHIIGASKRLFDTIKLILIRQIFKIYHSYFHFNAMSDKYTLNCILIYRMHCFRMHKLLYVINRVIDVGKYLMPSNHKMCYIINLDLHLSTVVNRIHML